MRKANLWGKPALIFLLGLLIAGCSQVIDSTTPIDDIFSQGTSQSGSLYVVNGSTYTDIAEIMITPQSSGPRSIKTAVKPGKPWQSSIRKGEYKIKVGNNAGDWSVEKAITIELGKVVELRYNWDIVDGGSWEETESDGGTLRIINRSGEDISEVRVTKLPNGSEEKLYLVSDIYNSTSRAFVLEKAAYRPVKIVKLSGPDVVVDEDIDLGKDGVKKDVTILVEPNGHTVIDNDKIIDPSSPTLTPGNNGYLWVFNGSSNQHIVSVKILARTDSGYPPDRNAQIGQALEKLAPDRIAPNSAKVWKDVSPGTYKVFVRYDGEIDYKDTEVTVGGNKDGVTVSTDDGIYAVDPDDIWGSDSNVKNPGVGGSIVVGYGMLQVINNTQKTDAEGGIIDPGIGITSVSIKAAGGTEWERITDSSISAGSFRNFYLREGNWDVRFGFADGEVSKSVSVTITGDNYVRITVNGKEDIEEPATVNYGDDNISLRVKNMAENDTLKITNIRIADETNRIKMESLDPLVISKDDEYLWPGRLQPGIYRVMVEVNGQGYAESRNITLKTNDRKVLEFFLGETAPGDLDRTGLDDSISEAQDLLNNTPANAVNGADIPPSQNWVPKDVWDKLKDALDDARQTLGDSASIQEDYDNAQANLDARIEEFENATKPGTQQVYKGDLLAAITDAKAARNTVVVSSDGSNVGAAIQWVTSAVWDSLANAIAHAEGVAQDGNATQAQVNTEITDLLAAVKIFTDAKQPGTYNPPTPPIVVDKSVLNGKIIEAENLKTGVVIDTDAENVAAGTYWVTQSVMNDLNSAITAAQQVATAPGATQSEVDNAVNTLQSAITAFISARSLGTKGNTPVINISQLELALVTAGTVKNSVVISVNGSDVMPANYWVTQSVWDIFGNAISAAEAVRANPGSQATVDNAVSVLTTATNSFIIAKQPGKYAPPVLVDKTALIAAINSANQAKSGVVINTNADNVAPGVSWVTQSVMDALNNAVSTAQGAANNTGITQSEVNNATTTLQNAINTFNSGKNQGTPLNTSALTDKLTAAADAKAGVLISGNGSDVISASQWVTQTVMDTFSNAISAAETVRANSGTQAAVNAAISALDTAIGVFDAAKKPGTYVPSVDLTALIAAINSANQAKSGVVINTDADNVAPGISWVTQSVMDALNSAITTAQGVATNTGATQVEVNNATTALKDAIAAFTKQQGTSINISALAAKLTEAVNAKTGVLISVDGTEVIPASQWVTQFVMDTFNGKINDAQSVQANPGTQAAVNAAISALDAAIGGFNAAKKPGTYVPPVDKTALIAAINAAEQARAGVAQSNDNGFTLPSGSVYVTIGAWNTFAGVITTAIGIRDNNNATQTQVDDAVAALTAATGSFNTAKQTAVVDRSALNAAIGLAEGARTGIERSTNGGTDIPKNEQWVTPAVWTAFDNAVTAARTVWASSAASQKQVNDAKNALEAAQTVFTGNIKPGLEDNTSTKLTVKNIDHTKDELLYLNLYPVNGGATLELVKKGTTSVVPYQGTRSFDNIPEGSYRLRYRCSSSGTVLYPSSAGIVIRLKGGYETYLELPGNGEVPRADIKRIGGGPITGTSTFNLTNNYTSNVTAIALYPKELGYFASELSGGIRMSATITAAYYDQNSGASKNGGTMSNPFNVAPGVYWLRVWTSATARYSYDSSRWLPVFAFPDETIMAAYESGGVKFVEYKKK